MSWFVSELPHTVAVDELVLRRFEVSDAPRLVQAVTESLPELREWMPWAKFEPQTVEQREELIRTWHSEWESKSNFGMGIFMGDVCIGSSGLHLRGGIGDLEIGYWVSTPYTCRGIATRVSAALTSVSFSCPEVQTVSISHDVANVKSEKIPKRLGFSIVKEYQRTPEAPSETGTVRLWSMSREDWNSR